MTATEFKILFMPFRDKIFRIALRISGNVEDAEDITQEVYIRFWNNRLELSKKDNLEAYSITIAKNMCIDFLRMRKTSEQLAELNGEEPSADMAEVIDNKDCLNAVIKIVDCLPEKQRLAIKMHDLAGFSFKEIAEAINEQEGNVRTLLSRARKKVRSEFTKTEKV